MENDENVPADLEKMLESYPPDSPEYRTISAMLESKKGGGVFNRGSNITAGISLFGGRKVYPFPPYGIAFYTDGVNYQHEPAFEFGRGVFAPPETKYLNLTEFHAKDGSNALARQAGIARNLLNKMTLLRQADIEKRSNKTFFIEQALPVVLNPAIRRVKADGTLHKAGQTKFDSDEIHYGAYIMAETFCEGPEWLGPLFEGLPVIESFRWFDRPYSPENKNNAHFRFYDPVFWANHTRYGKNWTVGRPANALTEMRLEHVYLCTDKREALAFEKDLRTLFLKDAYLYLFLQGRPVFDWSRDNVTDRNRLSRMLGGIFTQTPSLNEDFLEFFQNTSKVMLRGENDVIASLLFNNLRSQATRLMQPKSIWLRDPEWSQQALARLSEGEPLQGEQPTYQEELVVPWTDGDIVGLDETQPDSYYRNTTRKIRDLTQRPFFESEK